MWEINLGGITSICKAIQEFEKKKRNLATKNSITIVCDFFLTKGEQGDFCWVFFVLNCVGFEIEKRKRQEIRKLCGFNEILGCE
jgi:hypothetical protein